MSILNTRKLAVIGCGFVGSASAFALMQSGLFSEMVLIDANRARAEGEALDSSLRPPAAIFTYGKHFETLWKTSLLYSEWQLRVTTSPTVKTKRHAC